MLKQKATEDRTQAFKMSGAGKKGAVGPSGVVEWIRSACHFATDRNDFRRCVNAVLSSFR